MDGIESNKSSLPVNGNDHADNNGSTQNPDAPTKKAKRPRRNQGKEFEKTSSDKPGEKNQKPGEKTLGESETEIEGETTI